MQWPNWKILVNQHVLLYGIPFNLFSLRAWLGFLEVWNLLRFYSSWLINAFFTEGVVTPVLQWKMVCLLIKKTYLDWEELNTYCSIGIAPFFRKMTELEMPRKLQGFLNEVNSLHPFQSSFKPGYEIEKTLVTLVDDLHRVLGGEVQPSWFFWTFVAFDAINHNILLDWLVGARRHHFVAGLVLPWITL